ncbi:histidine kinase [Paenibacillus sp. LMG 31456]|uniref:histidine kinase n=1 Tax=Paenibacillus foliorum TaxID=2654974 RepID=A0A972GPT7_9BACL|nr:ATP-binding protein [Paenibacillus foliorum]NOU92189.1 histidine kinase [Paenibacillus foliorum]
MLWIKSKLSSWILLFFLLMIVAVFTLPEIQGKPEEWLKGDSPKASQGVMDLTKWNFKDNGSLWLNGEWEFYWAQLYTPESFKGLEAPEMAVVPGSWNRQPINSKSYSGSGFVTYRLKVILPLSSSGRTYAMSVPFITSAYSLWINGELLAESGKVGTSYEESLATYSTKTVGFHPNNSEIEILLQVSNFHHMKGGLRQPFELGLFDQIIPKKEISVGFDMLLFGSLMIMGLYHLGLFSIRPNDRSTLYFGLFCVLIALRTIVIGEITLLKVFPSFPWELELKLEYISAYLGLVFFILFIGELFPNESNRKIQRSFILISSCYTVLTLVFPAMVYTRFLISFHIILGLAIVFELYVLMRAWYLQRQGCTIILVASFIFAVSIINDMIYANEWVSTTGRASGFGLLFFIICQSGVLSMKLSRAFSNEEKMSAILAQMNSSLSIKIKDRTADLELVNDELRVKNSEMSRLETSRSHLLSNISHDLGTPLTTIQCYIEAILDGMVDTEEQRKQYVQLIHGKVLGMGRLIEDLFQLSQLEARQVAFQKLNLSTEILMESLFSRYKLDASNAGISYELIINGKAAESGSFSKVEVDVERLHQVFSNLIYNSIKFTQAGGKIRVEMIDDGDSEMLCRISDTGAGITANDMPFIFDRFYTSNRSRNSVSGGKGLGLSISKEIIESHGGKIWVERSVLNVGTEFCFTVPIQTS